MAHDETPEAGDEWVAKALLIGAVIELDLSVWGTLWAAHLPAAQKTCYGVTQARAARKLIRSITGVEDVQR